MRYRRSWMTSLRLDYCSMRLCQRKSKRKWALVIVTAIVISVFAYPFVMFKPDDTDDDPFKHTVARRDVVGQQPAVNHIDFAGKKKDESVLQLGARPQVGRNPAQPQHLPPSLKLQPPKLQPSDPKPLMNGPPVKPTFKSPIPELYPNHHNLPLLMGSHTSIPDVKSIPLILPKIVHLDLKGAPPKLSYLKKLFPLLKTLGATGLLVEYEDMFPYWGVLSKIAAGNAYNNASVTELVAMATREGLEVIPLVQTFGHLEFVLKYEEFAHLREAPNYANNLNPAKTEALHIVMEMIEQILALHPNVSQLHIGCDEVFYLGYSKESKEMMKTLQTDLDGLYLQHVKNVGQYVRNKHPKITPIMWEDKIRKINGNLLRKHLIGRFAEPMIWNYKPDVYDLIPKQVWEKYSKVFRNVWIGTSFKGATGIDQIIPDIYQHMKNHMSWLKMMKEYHSKYVNIKGIALTGWQRYDHFAGLCDLLPAGIPSLTIMLHTLNHGGFKTTNDLPTISKQLGCDKNNFPYKAGIDMYPACKFPGSSLYRKLVRAAFLRARVNTVSTSQYHDGYLTNHHLSRKFTNTGRLHTLFSDNKRISSEYKTLIKELPPLLLEIYDSDMVTEWMDEHVYMHRNRYKELYQKALTVMNVKFWPRRPFVRGSYSPKVGK